MPTNSIWWWIAVPLVLVLGSTAAALLRARRHRRPQAADADESGRQRASIGDDGAVAGHQSTVVYDLDLGERSEP
ncbi:MAG: hypothetical protein ACRD0U_18910 [Acidimicrobiales bacterium]